MEQRVKHIFCAGSFHLNCICVVKMMNIKQSLDKYTSLKSTGFAIIH